MRIAVYSGSFNPLHIGHLAIMEYLTGEKGFDWVYLVVSPKNPLKEDISADSGQERYDAAVAAVKRHPELHVWVDNIELLLPPPQYTVRTLHELKKREPENDFMLIIGGDNLATFTQWKDYQEILLEFGVMVYPRDGYDSEAAKAALLSENRDYRIEIIDAPIVDISSTEIREREAQGEDMTMYRM